MTPSRFWKTPGYTIDPMKPRFIESVQPLAPHTTPRNVIRFPSGLEVEDMTDREPRPLWPLLTFALLIWAAVIGAAWYLAA